jgi:hypothetical protein
VAEPELSLTGIDPGRPTENRYVEEEPQLRPLPPPPRCRGIPLDDGNYTGCAYGYGDLAPFSGPRDCPVCNGSGFEGPIETTLPPGFGDPECCGCLNGVIRGDQADIVCNECGTVLRTVPAANVGQTLTELEITLEVASEMCPHCGSVNLFQGFSKSSAERPFCVWSNKARPMTPHLDIHTAHAFQE